MTSGTAASARMKIVNCFITVQSVRLTLEYRSDAARQTET
jgi:hypothetical protein